MQARISILQQVCRLLICLQLVTKTFSFGLWSQNEGYKSLPLAVTVLQESKWSQAGVGRDNAGVILLG